MTVWDATYKSYSTRLAMDAFTRLQVSMVECWQLKRNEDEDASVQQGSSKAGGAGSVLDRTQDKTFLSLANVKVKRTSVP